MMSDRYGSLGAGIRKGLMDIALAVRGEPLARELQSLEESQWLPQSDLIELQRQKLLALIDHSRQNIPFYRDRLPSSSCTSSLSALLGQIPILEKGDVRRLASETLGRIRPWQRHSVRRTAGTSGDPLVVLVDPLANARTLAARARALGWFGVRPGDRECRLWGRAQGSRERALLAARDWLLNRLRVSLDDLGPDQIEAAVRRILAARPRYIYGYSSMVLEFGAALAEVGGHRLKVAVVTTEYSRPYQRERLAGELGCPVVEEYGCSEVDIIAHQCPDGGYHIPAENMIVEVMPRDASDPLFGDIVVTDLNNHLMPLLRYRLGDEVRLSRVACPCGRSLPLLESVTGRTLYQYFHFPDGRRVHSYVFDYFIDELVASGVDVTRYQIRQRAADSIQILMVLGRDDPAVRAMIVANGRDRLQARLGPGIGVGFEFVQSISAPPGQKLEAFVPMRVE